MGIHTGQKMYILAQNPRAKGVHCLDVGLIDPEHLAAQMAVIRLLRHAAAQLLRDLAPQLRRGRLGIGDNEEVIHMTVFFLHVGKQTLYQYLGLARACRRRNQQTAAPVMYRCRLLRRQLYLSHGLPPLLLFSPRTARKRPAPLFR